MSTDSESRRPTITINKAGWRAGAVALLAISLALVGALVAQISLNADGRSPSDPLTTVALVLAVLAFLVQIFVYVFQTNAATRSTERAEELNTRTQGVLDEIRITSNTTQKVLVSQFDRLLEYVVQGPSAPPVVNDESEESEEASGFDAGGAEPEQAVTPESIERAVRQALSENAARQSKLFSSQLGSGPSQQDLHVLEFLRSWPSRAEAEEMVGRMRSLSPLALMRLKRFADAERTQRLRGQRVGLVPGKIFRGPSTELIDAGLVRFDGDRNVLTAAGQDLARLVVTGKDRTSPPWLAEVLAPLAAPLNGN